MFYYVIYPIRTRITKKSPTNENSWNFLEILNPKGSQKIAKVTIPLKIQFQVPFWLKRAYRTGVISGFLKLCPTVPKSGGMERSREMPLYS